MFSQIVLVIRDFVGEVNFLVAVGKTGKTTGPLTTQHVLASGAVSLISRLLGDLFTSEPQSEQLIARSQFNDLACMYEDIEARAFRCSRNGIESQLTANIDVERQVCAELNASSLTSYLNGLDSFLPQLSTVTRQLNRAAPDARKSGLPSPSKNVPPPRSPQGGLGTGRGVRRSHC